MGPLFNLEQRFWSSSCKRARLHCTDLNFLKWVVTYWTGFCVPLFVAESTAVYSNQARIFFMLTELSGQPVSKLTCAILGKKFWQQSRHQPPQQTFLGVCHLFLQHVHGAGLRTFAWEAKPPPAHAWSVHQIINLLSCFIFLTVLNSIDLLGKLEINMGKFNSI